MAARRDVGRSVRRGGVALFLSQVTIHGMQAVSIVVLARLLRPVDFGIVAAALAVTSLVQKSVAAELQRRDHPTRAEDLGP